MSEIQLTKNGEKLFCQLYKLYLNRRKEGATIVKAANMGSLPLICERLEHPMPPDDVLHGCRELSRAGYLHVNFASGTVYHSYLTDAGIAYMENRFKGNAAKVADFLLTLISKVV